MIIVKVRTQKRPGKEDALLATIPADKDIKAGDYIRIVPIKGIDLQDFTV